MPASTPSVARLNRALPRVDHLWDATLSRTLSSLNLRPGAKCLTLGRGLAQVARWLGARGASVTAVPSAAVDERLNGHRYDLVHVRHHLALAPDRSRALKKLVGAVRPGGWLVVEEYDMRPLTLLEPFSPAWTAVTYSTLALLEEQGADPFIGTRLHRQLLALGLDEVQAVGRSETVPTSAIASKIRPLFESVADDLVGNNLVTVDEYHEAICRLAPEGDPPTTSTPAMITARGRKPR